jgi:ATP-dependent Lon protease
MPVGGIKEKILAAKRAGIKDIIIGENNRKNVDEIEKSYIKGLKFHYVRTMDEVLANALLPARVKDGIDIDGFLKKEEKEK